MEMQVTPSGHQESFQSPSKQAEIAFDWTYFFFALVTYLTFSDFGLC
jgi:hypothetical protein